MISSTAVSAEFYPLLEVPCNKFSTSCLDLLPELGKALHKSRPNGLNVDIVIISIVKSDRHNEIASYVCNQTQDAQDSLGPQAFQERRPYASLYNHVSSQR